MHGEQPGLRDHAAGGEHAQHDTDGEVRRGGPACRTSRMPGEGVMTASGRVDGARDGMWSTPMRLRKTQYVQAW